MKTWMAIALGVLLAFALAISGCSASSYLGTTKASYIPGGAVNYESNKNNEGFHAKIELAEKGNIKAFDISTTATTPESAIAAVAAAQAAMMKAFTDVMQMVGPLITKGLAGGATGGTGAIVPKSP